MDRTLSDIVAGERRSRICKVVYSAAMSLDGHIAGPKNESDWIMIDPEIDFGAMFARFDTRTYETTRTGAGVEVPGVKAYVSSRTLQQADMTDQPSMKLVEAARRGREARVAQQTSALIDHGHGVGVGVGIDATEDQQFARDRVEDLPGLGRTDLFRRGYHHSLPSQSQRPTTGVDSTTQPEHTAKPPRASQTLANPRELTSKA